MYFDVNFLFYSQALREYLMPGNCNFFFCSFVVYVFVIEKKSVSLYLFHKLVNIEVFSQGKTFVLWLFNNRNALIGSSIQWDFSLYFLYDFDWFLLLSSLIVNLVLFFLLVVCLFTFLYVWSLTYLLDCV